MPSMRRRLFTLLSAVSLLLGVATCVMWVRSYGGSEMFVWIRPTTPPANGSTGKCTETSVFSSQGVMAIHIYSGAELADPNREDVGGAYRRGGFEYARDFPDLWDSPDNGPSPTPLAPPFSDFLVSYTESSGTPTGSYHVLYPHWAGVITFGGVPVGGVLLKLGQRVRRRSASRSSRCPACGYDLRASPGRCPECGAVQAVPSKLTEG
jgi:hypothetical protein